MLSFFRVMPQGGGIPSGIINPGGSLLPCPRCDNKSSLVNSSLLKAGDLNSKNLLC